MSQLGDFQEMEPPQDDQSLTERTEALANHAENLFEQLSVLVHERSANPRVKDVPQPRMPFQNLTRIGNSIIASAELVEQLSRRIGGPLG